MKEIVVEIEAYKDCSDIYGVFALLKRIVIDVKYVGIPFAEYLKKSYKIIKF